MFSPGGAGQLHDHPAGSSGPAVGYRSCQRETGARREKEPADPRERREQETTEGDRGQDTPGFVFFGRKHPGR